MNSYRTNKAYSLRGALIAALLLSIALFAIDAVSRGAIRSYVRTVSALTWSSAAAIVNSIDTSGFFRTHRALESEIVALKAELSLRDEEHARYRNLVEEIASLSAMARLAETEQQGVTAHVVSSFASSPYGTFLVSAGRSEGISTGDVVLTPGGFVLGTITDADSHTATVEAMFAPTHVVDLKTSDVAFSAEGRGGGNAKAEVPRDATIAVGDPVTVPYYNGRPAGVIGGIESASSSATQSLYIRLPVNLDTLSYVYVIPHK